MSESTGSRGGTGPGLTSLLCTSFAQGVTSCLLFLIPKMGILIMIASESLELL